MATVKHRVEMDRNDGRGRVLCEDVEIAPDGDGLFDLRFFGVIHEMLRSATIWIDGKETTIEVTSSLGDYIGRYDKVTVRVRRSGER